MRAMIDGRVYDTDRAEEAARFTRQVDMGPLFCGDGGHWTPSHEFILYRTVGGLFFAYDTEAETIAALTRKEARAILREQDPNGDVQSLCWGA